MQRGGFLKLPSLGFQAIPVSYNHMALLCSDFQARLEYLTTFELMPTVPNLKAPCPTRRRRPGTREQVSSRRINLECNTYV
jgi:hypothetical protein